MAFWGKKASGEGGERGFAEEEGSYDVEEGGCCCLGEMICKREFSFFGTVDEKFKATASTPLITARFDRIGESNGFNNGMG